MKKSTWVFLFVILVVFLAMSIYTLVTRHAYDPESSGGEALPVGVKFEIVANDEDHNNYVYRELMTNFMYYGYLSGSGKYDGVAPLYDPEDKQPLTYSRYMDLRKLVDH